MRRSGSGPHQAWLAVATDSLTEIRNYMIVVYAMRSLSARANLLNYLRHVERSKAKAGHMQNSMRNRKTKTNTNPDPDPDPKPI